MKHKFEGSIPNYEHKTYHNVVVAHLLRNKHSKKIIICLWEFVLDLKGDFYEILRSGADTQSEVTPEVK